MNAGMPQIVHIIAVMFVDDVYVVIVVPAAWPSLIVSEPVAAVLEAVIPAYHLGTHHVERVAMTEIGMVVVVRNAAILVAIVPVAVIAVVTVAIVSVIGTMISNGLLLVLVLRLLLVLSLPGFSFTSSLFLSAFLSEARKCDSEKQ